MNILFFKYALEVGRTGSITQAAENLFIAQPNLSKAIKEAERSLGYKIFRRTSKGVVPTQKGMLFLEKAAEIVRQIQDVEQIASIDTHDMQRMHISIPNSNFITEELVCFIASLDTSKPIDLRIKETGSMQAIRDVADGYSDFGIARHKMIYEKYFNDYISEKKLVSDLLCTYSYRVLLSRNHALSAAKSLKSEELKTFTQILHGKTLVPYFGECKDEADLNTEKRIHIYERATRFELLSSVLDTFMISPPMPQDILNRYNLVQIKYDSPTNLYKKLFVYQPGHTFSEFEEKFTACVRQYMDEPVDESTQ